jgi:hypothetical protein
VKKFLYLVLASSLTLQIPSAVMGMKRGAPDQSDQPGESEERSTKRARTNSSGAPATQSLGAQDPEQAAAEAPAPVSAQALAASVNMEGHTPLSLAAQYSHIEYARILVNHYLSHGIVIPDALKPRLRALGIQLPE